MAGLLLYNQNKPVANPSYTTLERLKTGLNLETPGIIGGACSEGAKQKALYP